MNTTWAHIYTDRPAFYTNKEIYVINQRVFHTGYHPNADKWTTARSHTVTLTGEVTGTASQTVDGTGNKTWSIATTVGDSVLDNNYVQILPRHNADGDSLVVTSRASIAIWDVSGASDAPSSAGDGLVLSAGWDSASWGIQQYHDFHSNDLYLRAKNNGSMTSWDRVFHDTYHPNADTLTTARTISLGGDVTGSASFNGSSNITITAAVANDSHNHNHSDGNFTVNGVLQAGAGSNHISTAAAPFRWQRSGSGQTGQDDNVSVHVDDSNIYFTHNNDADGDASGYNFRYMTGGTATNLLNFSSSTMTYKGQTVFHTGYHPNADKWTTARTITLGGDLTGNVSIDGSANVTLTATVADDSHNHVISNVDGLQTALDAKPDILASGYNGTYNIPIHTGGDLYTSPTAGGVTITGSSGQISTPSHGNSSQWNTAYGWGNHASAGYITGNQTITLSGDVSGSGTTSINVTVADDSHNHVLANVDRVALTSSQNLNDYNTQSIISWGSSQPTNSPGDYSTGFVLQDNNQPQQLVQTYGGAANKVKLYGRRKTSGTWDSTWTQYFSDHYHPNADTLTTARTISLGGDLSGSASFNGSANITITAAVADDSHNHVISNVDGLQTALDGKQTSSTFTSNAYLQNRGTTSQNTVGDGRGVTFNYSGSSGNKPTGTDHSLMTMAYSDAWQNSTCSGLEKWW